MLATITQADRLIAVETPLGADVLLLESFAGAEEMSRPFRFEATMLADTALNKHLQVSADKLVGKKMTISVELGPGKQRFFSALVKRFSVTGRDERFFHYRVELVPWLSLLEMRSNCRFFQNMTVPEILDKVFDEAGFKHLVRFSPSRSYTKWDYCAQYRESDFHFISRLMEQEGIFYYFEHPQEAKSDPNGYEHLLVLLDAPNYKDCPGQPVARFISDAGMGEREDTIRTWEVTRELLSSEWALRDSHFEAPSNSYEVAVPAMDSFEPAQNLKLYDYPGDYTHKFNEPGQRLGEIRGEADRAVKLKMEAEELGQLAYAGTSHCRAFSPGYRFKVMNIHGFRGTAGPYVLTSVQHTAVQHPGYTSDFAEPEPYRNSFTCIPAEVACRAPRRTPKPVVPGPQTAKVVDESQGGNAEEIWPDKFGRVRVRFPWDRDGKFSCWMRVSQPWAGKGWGHQWIPRTGDEVVVDFLEGDPDRPLIVGSVYNGENMPPFALPANKTQSGVKTRSSKGGGADNFNMIRFEDKKGSEVVYIHAEKDKQVVVENDRTESVGHDETIDIGNDRTETVGRDESVTIENDQTHSVGRNRTRDVGKDESITITENRTESVGKKEEITIGTDRVHNVGANDQLDVGKKLTISVGDEIIIRTGDASITMKKNGDIQIKGKTINVIGSGKIGIKASSEVNIKGSKVTNN